MSKTGNKSDEMLHSALNPYTGQPSRLDQVSLTKEIIEEETRAIVKHVKASEIVSNVHYPDKDET